jgi:hypothetical protein
MACQRTERWRPRRLAWLRLAASVAVSKVALVPNAVTFAWGHQADVARMPDWQRDAATPAGGDASVPSAALHHSTVKSRFTNPIAFVADLRGQGQRCREQQRLFSDRKVLAREGERVAVEADEHFHRVRSRRQIE